MTWPQQSNSPPWAEVKPHLSDYGPSANQNHHSKMPVTIDYLGSRVSASEGPAPLSVVCRLILSQGLGTTPFSLSPQKAAQEARFLSSQESPLTSRMWMLRTNMEHCVPSSLVAACLTCQQETWKKNWIHQLFIMDRMKDPWNPVPPQTCIELHTVSLPEYTEKVSCWRRNIFLVV